MFVLKQRNWAFSDTKPVACAALFVANVQASTDLPPSLECIV